MENEWKKFSSNFWCFDLFFFTFRKRLNVSVGKKGSETVKVETCFLSTAVPAYIRFDAVKLDYYSHSLCACEHMKLHLQHFKNALIGSKFSIIFRFQCNQSEKESSLFLDHFVKEVLPITGGSQSYEFKMYVSAGLYSEFDVEDIITGIIAPLPNSSDLSFDFMLELPRNWWQQGRFKHIDLPYKQISNWLTHKTHQQSGKKDKRSLSIFIDSGRVWNYTAMSKCVENVANNAFCLLS